MRECISWTVLFVLVSVCVNVKCVESLERRRCFLASSSSTPQPPTFTHSQIYTHTHTACLPNAMRRHQQELEDENLPQCPYRLFISHLHSLPEQQPRNKSEGEGEEAAQQQTPPPPQADESRIRLLLERSQRVVEEVRVLGVVVKHEEQQQEMVEDKEQRQQRQQQQSSAQQRQGGFWLDDGSGIIHVRRNVDSATAQPSPLLGQLCEVVGCLVQRRIPAADGAETSSDIDTRRGIEAQEVFLPPDPDYEASFMLSMLRLYRKFYLALPKPVQQQQQQQQHHHYFQEQEHKQPKTNYKH